MSSSTLTNIVTRINEQFPVKGQDNDSQGFRDNYKHIKDAFGAVDDNLDYLNKYTVKTDSTATYNGNTIEDVNLKNHSVELYSLDTQFESIVIDYALGSYQKFEVTQGVHGLSIINMPGAGKSGKITLSVTVPTGTVASINFKDTYINLSRQTNPFKLTWEKPNIFEIWNEEDSDTVYVKYLTDFTATTETTTASIFRMDGVYLGNKADDGQANYFTTNSNHATVVSWRENGAGRAAELGLVPNRISKVLRDGSDSAGPGSPIHLKFDSATDILPGAFFYTTVTNTYYTVTSVISTNTVAIAPNDLDVSNLTKNVDVITFTNPTDSDQPTLLNLVPVAANTSTGSKTNFVGSVFASKNRLEVTYQNYNNNTTNTFVVQTHQANTETSYFNTDLIDTSFVHNLLPIGSVIMWYGKKTEIPYGWTLCDDKGSIDTIINGAPGPKVKVPDLSNKFVIGAVEDYPLSPTFLGPSSTVTNISTTTGGLTDTILPAHSHSAVFTGTALPVHGHSINDPGHTHSDGNFSYLLKPPYAGSLTGNDTVNSGSEQAVGAGDGGPMVTKTTGITVESTSSGTPTGTITVASTGTSSTGTNLPPYFALYYIMKISGFISTGSGIVTI